MTVNIYPAIIITKEGRKLVEHADNWETQSTLNLSNSNFWTLIYLLNLDQDVLDLPAHISLQKVEKALKRSPIINRYTDHLKTICAVAHIKKAPVIAFS